MGSSQGDLPNAHIELEHVSFSYPLAATDERETAPAPALQDVSLSIAAGEHVCVLGGNGSGKSTLLRLMNALLLPSAGSVRVMGSSTSEPGAALEARRQVAMVFQHPEDQMVTSIAADDVAFGPENLGVPRDEIAVRVRESLDAVGMLPLAQADPTDLSGGQKQRVAIAGALAMRPRVLLLDEPSAMLDAEGHRAVQEIIAQLNARGITIVHVTHFMDDALLARRVIVMDQGRIALDGTPAQVFSHRARIHELGLELPFALQLEEALERRGADINPLPGGLLDDRALADALARRLAASGSASPHDAREDKVSPDDRPPASAAIFFQDVSFSYAFAQNARKRRVRKFRLPFPGRRDESQGSDGTPMEEIGPLALSHASFSVPAGAITALIGRTGAGKSTAVELSCALKVPARGTVTVDGVDTTDLTRRHELRAHVGYVSQLPERQLFGQTVYEDVAFGPRNLGLDENAARERVVDALGRLGIDPAETFLQRSPFALSGGQQRAVALAGILAMRQPILVLDEPMAGLDPAGRERMHRLLFALKQRGATLLLVTHSMDDVAELADHVIVLSHGRVASEGSPRAVFSAGAGDCAGNVGNSATPGTTFLNSGATPGLPSALAFQRELAKRGIELPGTSLTLEELADALAEIIAPEAPSATSAHSAAGAHPAAPTLPAAVNRPVAAGPSAAAHQARKEVLAHGSAR